MIFADHCSLRFRNESLPKIVPYIPQNTWPWRSLSHFPIFKSARIIAAKILTSTDRKQYICFFSHIQKNNQILKKLTIFNSNMERPNFDFTINKKIMAAIELNKKVTRIKKKLNRNEKERLKIWRVNRDKYLGTLEKWNFRHNSCFDKRFFRIFSCSLMNIG